MRMMMVDRSGKDLVLAPVLAAVLGTMDALAIRMMMVDMSDKALALVPVLAPGTMEGMSGNPYADGNRSHHYRPHTGAAASIYGNHHGHHMSRICSSHYRRQPRRRKW